MRNNLKVLRLTFLIPVFFLFFGGTSFASDEGHEKKDGFNAGETIMGHVNDSYSIHFLTMGEDTDHPTHISLPLPVIAYSDKGLDIFSSSNFDHGHSSHKSEKTGLAYYIDDEGSLATKGATSVYDFSITKNVVGLFLGCFIILVIFLSVAKAYKKRPNEAPRGLQSFMEPLILFVRDDIAKANIGEKKYHKFLPFLLTVFFFIWIGNLLGLIPFLGGLNVTGSIGVIMVLAGFVFLITTFSGNKNYWQHIFMPPGIPWWLYPIMIPIEFLQIFSKPFILMVRLTANITAGHIIILSFVSLIMLFGQDSAMTGYGVSIGSLVFMIFMNFLELLIAFIQAYVFTMLTAIYFGGAVEEHHEHG